MPTATSTPATWWSSAKAVSSSSAGAAASSNVGGLKVHPEEVEAVINRHRGVLMSLVKARRSPIIGAIVVADVVLDEETSAHTNAEGQLLKDAIIRFCRSTLPQHKVPAAVRFVPALAMTTAGKLQRDHA